jgi:hypothetical protein
MADVRLRLSVDGKHSWVIRVGHVISGLEVDNKPTHTVCEGDSSSVVVKTLCYKPEGRGFETR